MVIMRNILNCNQPVLLMAKRNPDRATEIKMIIIEVF